MPSGIGLYNTFTVSTSFHALENVSNEVVGDSKYVLDTGYKTLASTILQHHTSLAFRKTSLVSLLTYPFSSPITSHSN